MPFESSRLEVESNRPAPIKRLQGFFVFLNQFVEVRRLEIIEKFEHHLIENGIAPKTIESYVGDVKGFAEYLTGMGVDNSADLKRFYIASYKSHLMENKYAVATINKKINSLQAFNLFLIERKLATERVVSLRKDRIKVAAGSEGEVEVFSEQEVNQLMFFVQDRSKVILRNHLIVWLLLYTGVRVSELCGIQLSDLDYLTNTLRITVFVKIVVAN
ncbi:integrase [Brevibacillus panacihumi W25]|uniref:Integrase n=1 Tax=Brevibacillus panacihumi W25 TaxID=1408254 RepID=V6M9U1_9BACL|nr:site-specific integrase [Brevibacillus panacihumi]EST55346.1 integrase [Brevibacillus panacihumi W25]